MHHGPGPGGADDPRGGGRKAPRSPRLRSSATAGPSNAASTPKTRSATFCRPPVAWCALRRRRRPCSSRSPTRSWGARGHRRVRGGEIPMYYDSMIAKLIVHGTDRNDAIQKMRAALNGFCHPRHQQQHSVPGRAAGAPQVRLGRFQHGFHCRELCPWLRRRRRAARRSVVPGGTGRLHAPALSGAGPGISGQMAGHEVKVGESLWWPSLGAEGATSTMTSVLPILRQIGFQRSIRGR